MVQHDDEDEDDCNANSRSQAKASPQTVDQAPATRKPNDDQEEASLPIQRRVQDLASKDEAAGMIVVLGECNELKARFCRALADRLKGKAFFISEANEAIQVATAARKVEYFQKEFRYSPWPRILGDFAQTKQELTALEGTHEDPNVFAAFSIPQASTGFVTIAKFDKHSAAPELISDGRCTQLPVDVSWTPAHHLDKWLKAAVQALQVAGLRVPMAASLTPTQAVSRVQSSYRKRRNSTTDFNSVPMEKDEHADETRQGPRLRVQPSEVSGDVAGADLSSKEPQRSRREDRTSNDGLLFMAKFDPTVKVFVPHADRDHTSENKYRNTGDQGEVGENAYLFGSAMRFMPRLERNRMMRELGTERQVICRHRAPPSPPHSARGTPRSSATASAFRQRRTSPALQAPPRDPHELQSWLDERKKEILRERFGTQQPTSQLRRASGILLSPRERAMMRAESKASSREMVEFTPHLTPRRVVSVAKQVPKVPRRPHGGSAARTEGPRVAPKSPRGGPSHPNAPASHSHGFGYAPHFAYGEHSKGY